MPALPPWIAPADPAQHMAQGMRIGLAIGAQQAEQRLREQQQAERAAEFQQEQAQQAQAMQFKQVQAAKQDQLSAQEQALAENRFNLAASEAARKHQAFAEYQQAVAGGMDPNDAMLKYGPAMSANTGAAAAIRAHQQEMKQPRTWTQVTMPSGLETMQSSTGDIRFPPQQRTQTPARVPEGATFVPATDTTPAHWQLPAKAAKSGDLTAYQTIMERDRTEKALQKLLDDNSRFGDLADDAKPDPKWSKATQGAFKVAKAQAKRLRDRLDQLDNAGTTAPKADAKGRVKVKNKDGQVGTIPQDQLEEALAAGYTTL